MSEEVKIAKAKPCDLCKHLKRKVVKTAEYDLKTKMGPWVNVCEEHREEYAAYPDLGTGKGQRLIVEED